MRPPRLPPTHTHTFFFCCSSYHRRFAPMELSSASSPSTPLARCVRVRRDECVLKHECVYEQRAEAGAHGAVVCILAVQALGTLWNWIRGTSIK